MKIVALLLATLVVASSANPQKRFFIKDIENVLNTIGHKLHDIINGAKEQFDHLAAGSGINFDSVLGALMGEINSGTSQAACQQICESSARNLFGESEALMAGLLCSPACKAALAKLQAAAGA